MKTAINILAMVLLLAKAPVVLGAPFTCSNSEMNFPPDQKVSSKLCDTLLKSEDGQLLFINVQLVNPYPGPTGTTDPKTDTVRPGNVDTTIPSWVIERSNKLFHDFELFDFLDTSRIILPDHFNLTGPHNPDRYGGGYSVLLATKATIISMVDSSYISGIWLTGLQPLTLRKFRFGKPGVEDGIENRETGYGIDALGRKHGYSHRFNNAHLFPFEGDRMK